MESALQSEARSSHVMELEGTLMEHDLPIADFRFSGGKLVYIKEYPENARFYLDLWTPGNITEKQLQDFFTYRVPAWHRPSVQRACKAGGILPGDIDGFIRRIHGVWGDDHFWIRFPGETSIKWDDVKIRD